jgi:hypothetical protein
MSEIDPETGLRYHPRKMRQVTVCIPESAIEKLHEVAASKEMSFDALLKFYIGQGLRQDIAEMYSHRLMLSTERVLARHIDSEDERTEILREIRTEAAA